MSVVKPDRALTQKRIAELYSKFSWPMMHACITEHQKTVGFAISQMLWLRLVTGADTEETIAQDLKLVFPDSHDSIVAFGSLYFFKMKPALKESAIKKLQQHFAQLEKLKRAGDSAQ
ncbi:hypothetical protein [uncultured Thiodictyon sp.]|uniref:hypothetical protein n=1 Tax=uncultured Thiodictyon sp. TaxID=1846217 RepID=UPI0025DEEB42|nr:hypothetical protein [uncultured Thiodictyon sp.]